MMTDSICNPPQIEPQGASTFHSGPVFCWFAVGSSIRLHHTSETCTVQAKQHACHRRLLQLPASACVLAHLQCTAQLSGVAPDNLSEAASLQRKARVIVVVQS
jgi:hypothetical protein